MQDTALLDWFENP